MGKTKYLFRTLICVPIIVYQYFIKPIMKPCCRFYPSCSQYTMTAIQHFGVFKGGWRSVCRILRCHPWSTGGLDPVLPNNEKP